MSLRVTVVNAHRRYRIARKTAAAYVRLVVRNEAKHDGAISVVFVGSRRMRKMNAKYLGHHYGTDVLCFPLETGKKLEGELFVNLDKARAQARVYKVSFGNEVARLIIHGTLHLVGYDDRTLSQSRNMRKAEDRYLKVWFSTGEGEE